MAFPTTSILDNFDRANGSVGANWTTPLFFESNILKILSNQGVFSDFDNGGYWNPASFGPDAEVFATLAVTGAGEMYARVANPGGAALNCYQLKLNPTTTFLQRLDSGSSTQLGASIPTTWVNGDQAGMDCVGSTIAAYQAGVQLGTRSDATYSAAGYIGVHSNSGTPPTLDDFGGGTVFVPGASWVPASARVQYT